MSSNGSDKGPQWYSQGTAVRLYGGNIIKVSANENIRSVTFTFSEKKVSFRQRDQRSESDPRKLQSGRS